MRGPPFRDDDDKADRPIWFVYRRTANEFTGTPANATGWLVLIGCIVATNIVALGSSLLIARLWLWGIALTIPVSIVVGLWFTFRIVRRHGRELS